MNFRDRILPSTPHELLTTLAAMAARPPAARSALFEDCWVDCPAAAEAAVRRAVAARGRATPRRVAMRKLLPNIVVCLLYRGWMKYGGGKEPVHKDSRQNLACEKQRAEEVQCGDDVSKDPDLSHSTSPIDRLHSNTALLACPSHLTAAAYSR